MRDLFISPHHLGPGTALLFPAQYRITDRVCLGIELLLMRTARIYSAAPNGQLTALSFDD